LREPELVDLNQLVRDEMELLHMTTAQRVDLVLELEDADFRVLGERGTLGSALMNLCVNALDAMAAGGTLTLRTQRLPGDQVALTVQDTGHGMTPEVLARAMEPFFTSKPAGKGTGLGLAMVYATVKTHGGLVELTSAAGQGTTVAVRLPLAPAAATQAPAEAPVAPAAPLRLLLVDDDFLIRTAIPVLVAGHGHGVVTASGGQEALELLAAGLAVDLVILDLNMPGLNGLETLERLRRRHPELPVILATGHLDLDAAQAVAEDPWVRTVAKPFAFVELDRKFKELLPASLEP
jgi:CheY-like chemotaxis protein